MEVAHIAKVAAEEASKIAAGENLVQIAHDAGETPGETEKPLGNRADPDRMDVEEAPINTDAPNPDNQPPASIFKASPSSLVLFVSQRESRAPSSSGTTRLNFDEEITRILFPFADRATESTDATDRAEDLAFLEIMAIRFKGIQERYSQMWGRVQQEQKSTDLVDLRLKEKASEMRSWYNKQDHNLIR